MKAKPPFKVGDKVRRISLFGGHWAEVCSEKGLPEDTILTVKSVGESYYNPDSITLEEVDRGWCWDIFELAH